MKQIVIINNVRFDGRHRRTMICQACGKLINSSNRKCVCGSDDLYTLLYETSAAAALIKDDKKRLEWWLSGGRSRYHCGRRKFRPVINGKEVK